MNNIEEFDELMCSQIRIAIEDSIELKQRFVPSRQNRLWCVIDTLTEQAVSRDLSFNNAFGYAKYLSEENKIKELENLSN